MTKIYLERAITVNLDTGEQVKLLAGGNDVADEIAAHWFVQANIVKEPAMAEIADASQDEVISDLEHALQKADAKNADLTREVHGYQSNLKNAGESITDLQAKNLELRTEKNQLETQVEELQQRVAELLQEQIDGGKTVNPFFEDATVAQLKDLLTEKGVQFSARATKSELIALLG